MDRLWHAAQVGNVHELYDCIREEIDVRRCIFADQLIDGTTPLHITAIGGHVDFAVALIYLKPSWGMDLNQEMSSPMHLAVLHGHNELVLALLAVDKDLVRVKGKDGYTALHYAAEKGNLELLAYFLKDCHECLEDVTIRNETALHVAAQNGNLEALQILARYTQRIHLYCTVSMRHFFTSKDRNGDTVLHIAASNTQPEMIRVLLECQANNQERNRRGLTASNLLEMQSNTTPNKEICLHILHNGIGHKYASLKETVTLFSGRNQPRPLAVKLRYRITGYEQLVTTMTNRIVNMSLSGDKINALLVVLALILAATYQAILNPPGGVWQGSYSPNSTSAETHVGQSIMTSSFYTQFFVLNFIVFLMASIMTVSLLQVVSASNVVPVLSETLLSLLIGCLMLSMYVTQPKDMPRWLSKMEDINKSQILTYLSIFGYILGMGFLRRFFHSLLNPPPVKYLRDSSAITFR